MTRFLRLQSLVPPASVAFQVTLLVLGLSLVATGGVSAPAPAAQAETTEARLLEAELIELGEGDIAAALKIYQSLLETSDLETTVRARTLFAIGRAHRKLGELGAAKARYQELIAMHPGQARLVQAAHRYVAEIDAGANQLPDFDWVAQVEQNPQIQAQIFEWGMQLVGDFTGDKADPAAIAANRKLLALGSSVIPVLEPMLENTSNHDHRRKLAWILLSNGRIEQLPAYVESSLETSSRGLVRGLFELLSSLEPEVQARGLALVPGLPPGVSVDDRALLRIVLGETKSLEADILAIDSYYHFLLDKHWGDPALVPRLRDAMRQLASTDFAKYQSWIEYLLKDTPDRVRFEDLAPYLDPDSPLPLPVRNRGRLVTERLYELERYEDLFGLLEGPNGDRLSRRLSQRNTSTGKVGSFLDWTLYPEPVSVDRRAKIFRRTNEGVLLLRLALTDDRAIPEFVLWIEEFSASLPVTLESTERDEVLSLNSVFGAEDWIGYLSRYRTAREEVQLDAHFSHSFQAAMRELYQQSSDPWVRSFALSLLSRASADPDPKTEELWGELLGRGSEGSLDLISTLQVALGGIHRVPVVGGEKECADILGCLERIDREKILADPLGRRYGGYGREHLLLGSRMILLPTGGESGLLESLVLQALPDGMADVSKLLEPSIYDGARQQLIRFLVPPQPIKRHGLSELIPANFHRFADSEIAVEYCQELQRKSLDDSPTEALIRMIPSRSLNYSRRKDLLELLGKRAPENLASVLNWKEFLTGDDPLAVDILGSSWFQSITSEWREACLSAEQSKVRSWAWKNFQGKPSVDALRAGLTDTDPAVLHSVGRFLFAAETVEVLPLLHEVAIAGRLLDQRLQAIERITRFAETESVSVMQSLLDDPVLSVKTRALESLEEMEKTRAEREKWRRRSPSKSTEGGN